MRTARHNPAVTFFRSVIVVFLTLCVLALMFPADILAQGCAMCQTVMPHVNDPMARGMFWSVLFLMTAPFTVGVSIGGWLFYQHWSAGRAQRTVAPVSPLHLAYAQKEGQP
ncbi:MAG TPA: hypothetical protein VGX03_15310 [Candidatus Binatia bacterium]|jgi:hypothetical protein|nr:hypothetical protein [Candidatus Binatia bacterium]